MYPAIPFPRAVWLLRASLALVFLWFGLLKAFGVSPVIEVIDIAYPAILNYPFLFDLLILLELAIGVGLLVSRFARTAALLGAIHLTIATLGVLFSPQAFSGGFPFLTLIGEFVVKNIVLIAALFVLRSTPMTKNDYGNSSR